MVDLPSWAIATIVILVSLLLGGGAIWASSYQEGTLKFLLSSIGSVIVTSGIFSTIGAYVARVQIAKQLSEKYGLKQELEKAGILEIAKWPIEIPRTARKVDIFVIRAHAWFTMQVPCISTILSNEGSEVRICLVHPQGPMIQTLSSKFGEAEEVVKKKILDSIMTIVDCAEKAKKDKAPGRLFIKIHKLIPTHTYYRFDDERYVVWYALRRGRLDVPLLRLGPGELTDFFSDDFERFLAEEDVETVYDSNQLATAAREALSKLDVDESQLTRTFGSIQGSGGA